jgi:hypothetical protein
MCGRVALYSPPARLAAFLHARAGLDFVYDDRAAWTEGHPSWNVGPQRRLYGVKEVDGLRESLRESLRNLRTEATRYGSAQMTSS